MDEKTKRLGFLIGDQIMVGIRMARDAGIQCDYPESFSVTMDGVEHRFHLGKCSDHATSADHAFTSAVEAAAHHETANAVANAATVAGVS